MEIIPTPILLVEGDQVDVLRFIDAYWTISELPQ